MEIFFAGALVLLLAGCGGGTDHSHSGSSQFGIVWAGQGQDESLRGLYKVTSGNIATKVVDDEAGILRTYALSTTGMIAYKKILNNTETIYIADSQGNVVNQADFTADSFEQGGLAFSPDGTSLAEATVEEGACDIYVMPTSGTMTRTKITSVQNVDPASTMGWSTDGFIYFVEGGSNDRHVWKVNSVGGSVPELVSGNEGKMVNLSPDNSKISFVSLDGQTITVRDLASTDEAIVATLTGKGSVINGASWADDHTIIFVRQDFSFNYHIEVVDTTTLAVTEYNPDYFFGSVATFGSGGINNVD